MIRLIDNPSLKSRNRCIHHRKTVPCIFIKFMSCEYLHDDLQTMRHRFTIYMYHWDEINLRVGVLRKNVQVRFEEGEDASVQTYEDKSVRW